MANDGSIYFLSEYFPIVGVIRPNGVLETISGWGSLKYRSIDNLRNVEINKPAELVAVQERIYVVNIDDSNIVEIDLKTKTSKVLVGNRCYGWLDGKKP